MPDNAKPVVNDPEKLDKILRSLNDIVDYSQYQKDDYIAPLCQKHFI